MDEYLNKQIDILSRTIYGEARGEYAKVGISGLISVGNVVLNRVKKGGFFGDNLIDVCKKPKQFSCWNFNDPNFKIIKEVNRGDELFDLCFYVGSNLLKNAWPDLTMGCDHYHASYVYPAWAKGKKPKLKLGIHIFYELNF